MKNSFEETVSQLSVGDIIDFKEYSLDSREKKRLSIEINGAIIREVFPADTVINRDKLIEIYGEELDDADYLALSSINCPRYLLNLGLAEDGTTMNVKMITLNRDFYTMGLQTVEVSGNVNTTAPEPNYVMAQRGWM